jgi:MFS family permease
MCSASFKFGGRPRESGLDRLSRVANCRSGSVVAEGGAAAPLRSPPFVGVVALKLVLGFVLFATFDLIPLWAIATRDAGGLALTRKELATVLTAGAALQCLFTSTVMAKCMGRLGQRRSLAVGTLVGAASLAAVPFAGGLAARPFAVKLVVLALPLCGYYASGCSNFAAGSAVVNNVVPAERRGAANGVACMVEAVGKAVGPSVGATGLAIGLARRPGLVGAGAVFWALAALMLLSLCITRKLPASVERSVDDAAPAVELKAAEPDDAVVSPLAAGDDDEPPDGL